MRFFALILAVATLGAQQIGTSPKPPDAGDGAPYGGEDLLSLKDHGNPVGFRNIWIRRLRPYDQD